MASDPKWGHPLLTPEGDEIRVPHDCFAQLRRLGVLANNHARLDPLIYRFLTPEYDCITNGLRQMLGYDLSGPAWCVCTCRSCRKRESDGDMTALPGQYPVDDGETSRIVREVRAIYEG